MLEKYAGSIYQLLAPMLPPAWDKIALLGKVTDTSYEFVYYVHSKGSNGYQQCYAMAHEGRISGKQLSAAFDRLFEICLKARAEIEPGQRIWTNFTFLLNNVGDFSIDFGYGDYTAGVSDEWKAKYLV